MSHFFRLHKPEIGMQYNECLLASQAGDWEAVQRIYFRFFWLPKLELGKQFKEAV